MVGCRGWQSSKDVWRRSRQLCDEPGKEGLPQPCLSACRHMGRSCWSAAHFDFCPYACFLCLCCPLLSSSRAGFFCLTSGATCSQRLPLAPWPQQSVPLARSVTVPPEPLLLLLLWRLIYFSWKESTTSYHHGEVLSKETVLAVTAFQHLETHLRDKPVSLTWLSVSVTGTLAIFISFAERQNFVCGVDQKLNNFMISISTKLIYFTENNLEDR